MGHTGRDIVLRDHGPHDGTSRCALCASEEPHVPNAWCPVADSLICDGCCGALLSGEGIRMVRALLASGSVIDPFDLIESCTTCGRFTERMHEVSEMDEDFEEDVAH